MLNYSILYISLNFLFFLILLSLLFDIKRKTNDYNKYLKKIYKFTNNNNKRIIDIEKELGIIQKNSINLIDFFLDIYISRKEEIHNRIENEKNYMSFGKDTELYLFCYLFDVYLEGGISNLKSKLHYLIGEDLQGIKKNFLKYIDSVITKDILSYEKRHKLLDSGISYDLLYPPFQLSNIIMIGYLLRIINKKETLSYFNVLLKRIESSDDYYQWNDGLYAKFYYDILRNKLKKKREYLYKYKKTLKTGLEKPYERMKSKGQNNN